MAKKNEQLWHLYVSDKELLHYIDIFDKMLGRWTPKHSKQQGEAYKQTLETRLAELYEVYEERTSA
jgi:hypothetical protein